MKNRLPLIILMLAAAATLRAQDTLPRFSVINAGNNRVIIGWVNKLENVKQISIQRSLDSLTGYKSILTVPDPSTLENGYLDAKAMNDHMFYRLFVLQDKGAYFFTEAKRPAPDTIRRARMVVTKGDKKEIFRYPDSVTRVNPVVIRLDGFPGTDTVAVPNPVSLKKGTNSFVPSLYVYTCRDGYVCINLPGDEKSSKFSIKFYDADNIFLFELRDLKEREFKIDKANFYHAGWFNFELFEDGRLYERHKFYLEKDF